MAEDVTEEELAEMGFKAESASADAAEEAKADEADKAGEDGTVEPDESDAAETAGLEPEGEESSDKAGEPRQPDDDDEETPKASRRALKRARWEINSLRREIEALKKAQAKAPETPAQKTEPLRKSQFRTEEDYVEALVKTRMDEERAASAKAEAEARSQAELEQATTEAWVKKIHADFPTQEERDDYDEHLSGAFDGDPAAFIGAMAGEYVFQHPHGPKILRYLADRPKLCARIKDGHPFEQAEILKNIVAFVGKKPEAGAKTARKPVAPVGSIRTGGSGKRPVRSAEDIFEELAR